MTPQTPSAEALQRSIDAQQIILSTKGHVTLEEASKIVDTAIDSGRVETYQLITNLALIAAQALEANDPTGWAAHQQKLIISGQISQLENNTTWPIEPPC